MIENEIVRKKTIYAKSGDLPILVFPISGACENSMLQQTGINTQSYTVTDPLLPNVFVIIRSHSVMNTDFTQVAHL